MSTDVVFTYHTPTGGKVVRRLKQADKISSREALGLWKVDNKAWKVYVSRSQLEELNQDYRRADVVAGLPMGSPAFITGKVKEGTKPEKDGWHQLPKECCEIQDCTSGTKDIAQGNI